MLSHRLLLSGLLMLPVIFSGAANSASVETEHQSKQCRSLCASCQSLKPERINQICSLGLLTGCSCPENALNLTSAATDGTAATRTRNNCPPLEKDAVGYCPHGQQTDPAGCPLGLCRPPPGCSPMMTSQSTVLSHRGVDCRLFCPSGYQIDSNGCPTCRCRCSNSGGSVAASDEESRRCSTACASVGAASHDFVKLAAASGVASIDSAESDCSVCTCRMGQAAGTGAPAVAATTTSSSPSPCLLRCPNSCGPHGYADGESRDDRGCVRDCSCRCPVQSCTVGESCLRWEIDRFGCQVCSACAQPPRAPGCITKASLRLPNAMERLCPTDCSRQQFSISEDSSTGCLTCACTAPPAPKDGAGINSVTNANNARCSTPEPRCSNNCGPHGYLRDSQGCILPGCACSCPDLNACVTSCSRSGNFTVARDAYGCHACHCSTAGSSSCPAEFRCSRACGPHGYETDSATGCQSGCQCRCPKRSCGCFYGSRQDAYGCDTCECVTAVEYLQLLPF